MANRRNESLRSRKKTGKGVAKEKRPPQRGLGVARLEKMRLLEQNAAKEELAAAAALNSVSSYCTSFVPVYCFSPPFNLQSFKDSGVSSYRPSLDMRKLDSFGMGSEELTANISIVHCLDACSCSHCFKKTKERHHITPRDLSLSFITGERKSIFQGTKGDNSGRGSSFLDLSLSSIDYGGENERNFSIKEGGADSQTAERTVRAATEYRLLTNYGEGRKSCSSSTTLASSYEEEPYVISIDSPSLELTLGLSL